MVGTLAANVATVILVGTAIAVVRLKNGQIPTWYLPVTLGFAVAGLLGIARGNVLRRDRDDGLMRFLGWVLVIAGSVVALEMVMVWVGLAAGVK
jgi:hypothetical protein